MADRRRPSSRVGRRPATSRGEISDVGLELFESKGFDETSIDDIADAAGIARRTFFRYFPSKMAVPWGDFDSHLHVLRTLLDDLPSDVSLADGVMSAILDFNRFPDEERAVHRTRMRLILEVPALQAYSTLMYQGWRRVIAEYVARRLGASPDDLAPRTAGWIALGIAISAYEQWLTDENSDLAELLVTGSTPLYSGLP
ncbi:putative transcriptional regulatory protein TetR [Rhodococcoides trifolii]|uniref:Transcriptional regulatory protein TetR n=1 Tax=Rhodococcoides trifolii TaxID=908250 RepID=A0A917CS45_9NOCA|nr:mycofactocin system transcriptional regulator [Rhodococcus trifolii]GGF97036.1 putative transcriptional regulatory protein TetR [Rhodococcus trifolii]